jgi:hypothetical protein
MVYVGDRTELTGETALVGTAFFGGVPLAQFDDVSTGYGYGWTPFKHMDFEIVQGDPSHGR